MINSLQWLCRRCGFLDSYSLRVNTGLDICTEPAANCEQLCCHERAGYAFEKQLRRILFVRASARASTDSWSLGYFKPTRTALGAYRFYLLSTKVRLSLVLARPLEYSPFSFFLSSYFYFLDFTCILKPISRSAIT